MNLTGEGPPRVARAMGAGAVWQACCLSHLMSSSGVLELACLWSMPRCTACRLRLTNSSDSSAAGPAATELWGSVGAVLGPGAGRPPSRSISAMSRSISAACRSISATCFFPWALRRMFSAFNLEMPGVQFEFSSSSARPWEMSSSRPSRMWRHDLAVAAVSRSLGRLSKKPVMSWRTNSAASEVGGAWMQSFCSNAQPSRAVRSRGQATSCFMTWR
mmetsp:Transcript_55091/g.160778  ORF Transcript_55091/g.160778 Transcript_55091/m.160778 type:complete len:217 (+) Transcript_55091:109-759(+)